MKRMISFVFALLLLSACGIEGQVPASGPKPESSPSSVSQPAPGPSDATEGEDTPEIQRNEGIEEMIQKYQAPSPNGPMLADAKPNGLDLYFTDGTSVHVPIPSSGPGLLRSYASSLRDEAVVIAYRPEEDANAVLVISTTDRGQSWQSSELKVEGAENYNYCDLSFQDMEKGVLTLYKGQGETGLVFTTEDGGMTWSAPTSLPAMEALYGITVIEDVYSVVGEIKPDPVIFRSDDGTNWSKIILPLDTNEYAEGCCKYAAFSGSTGLAVALGTTTTGDMATLYFSSEDNGQSWSLYKTD